MKKLLALLLALVMVLSLCACGRRSGKDEEEASFEDPIKNLIGASFEGKSNKLRNLAPAEYWDYVEEEGGSTLEDLLENYDERWPDRKKYLEEEYGSNYKVTYEVTDKEELDEDVLEGIAEFLEDEYDIDKDKVKKGYDLEFEVTIKGYEGEEHENVEFASIQIGDDWYGAYYRESGGDYYVSFITG